MRLHPGYGHYALERLLYRLSISAQRDQFLLNGALLFDLWFDLPHRPTLDKNRRRKSTKKKHHFQTAKFK